MGRALITAMIFVAISPIASAQTAPPPDPLSTRSGWEIGAQVSDYGYEEPAQGVTIKGPRLGFTGAYTYARGTGWFLKLDGRYSYGSLEYEGSGKNDSVPDSIFDVRTVFGKDFYPGSAASLSPFAGLGYRYLYDDLRGTTSTGAVGYQRYSRYWYAPFGVTSRIKFNSGWLVVPTVEYDYFIKGEQTSQLTDIDVGFGDVVNNQNSGYGFRLSLMAENRSWAFGPWYQYWSIEDSDIVPVGFGLQAFEPKNETQEIGLDLKYRF